MSTENFTKRENPTEEKEAMNWTRLQRFRNYKMLLLLSHFNLITIAECGGAELNYKTTKADHRSTDLRLAFFSVAAVFYSPHTATNISSDKNTRCSRR